MTGGEAVAVDAANIAMNAAEEAADMAFFTRLMSSSWSVRVATGSTIAGADIVEERTKKAGAGRSNGAGTAMNAWRPVADNLY